MSTFQIRDLPAKAPLDGSELIELQEAAGGAGSSKQAPTGAFLPPDYISGLKMVWGSANSLSVTSGAAFISSLGRVLRSTSTLTLSGLSLTASTWYHIYLYDNAGTAAIECVTTAPAAPYFGTARAKTGDTSRRYVGSVKTDGSGNVLQFQHDARNNKISYLGTDYLPRNILSFGKATSTTNISCAAIIPVTAISIDILLTNADASATAETSNSSAALPMGSGTGHSYFGYASPNSGAGIPNHPVDSSLQINYMNLSTSTGGLYIDLNGYAFER